MSGRGRGGASTFKCRHTEIVYFRLWLYTEDAHICMYTHTQTNTSYQALMNQATQEHAQSLYGDQDLYTGVDSLGTLLNRLGLEHYENCFQQQEVDLDTFLTMSEPDLKEVGVTTLGARRKLQIAISGLPACSVSYAMQYGASRIVHWCLFVCAFKFVCAFMYVCMCIYVCLCVVSNQWTGLLDWTTGLI